MSDAVERPVPSDGRFKERVALLECYFSGQIEESAWTEHLRADPRLATMFQAECATRQERHA